MVYMNVEDENMVKAIYMLPEDCIDGKRINVEMYNCELNEAETEYAKDEYVSNNAFKQMVKEW